MPSIVRWRVAFHRKGSHALLCAERDARKKRIEHAYHGSWWSTSRSTWVLYLLDCTDQKSCAKPRFLSRWSILSPLARWFGHGWWATRKRRLCLICQLDWKLSQVVLCEGKNTLYLNRGHQSVRNCRCECREKWWGYLLAWNREENAHHFEQVCWKFERFLEKTFRAGLGGLHP